MLTEADKPYLREIAREIAKVVMDEHASSCPFRYELKIGFLKLILMLILSGSFGGVIVRILPSQDTSDKQRIEKLEKLVAAGLSIVSASPASEIKSTGVHHGTGQN